MTTIYVARLFYTAAFCFLLTIIDPVQAQDTPLRIAIHEAFYDVLSPYLSQHPDHYHITKIRGSQLRFLVKWKQAHKRFDAIIGIDPTCLRSEHIKPFTAQTHLSSSPYKLYQDRLIPYCFSVVGFVCKTKPIKKPETLRSFIETCPARSVITQHPRFSSLGRLTHQWFLTNNIKPDPKVLTHTKGWSGAYGLFKDSNAMCISGYISAVRALDPKTHHVITFSNTPHPRQWFYVGILTKATSQAPHVKTLTTLLLSNRVQKALEAAYVFPMNPHALSNKQKELLPPLLSQEPL